MTGRYSDPADGDFFQSIPQETRDRITLFNLNLRVLHAAIGGFTESGKFISAVLPPFRSMTDTPTMQEELDRQVAETIENAFFAVRARKMTTSGYHRTLECLWSGVTGLGQQRVAELMIAAMKEFPGGLVDTLRAVTVFGENVAVVKWQVDSATVERPPICRTKLPGSMWRSTPLGPRTIRC